MMFYSFKRFRVVWCIMIILIAILVGMYIYVHNRPVVTDSVAELQFSHESGFYENDFYLNISSNSGTVYYTLDGSIPTCESMVCDGPVLISDASDKPNVYSAREDVSAGYYSDLISQYSQSNPKYVIPQKPVDKCTVVRAVVYYGKDKYSKVQTETYFVGHDSDKDFDGLKVVSIVTDPDNLFDYNEGMYVTGAAFDDYMLSAEGSEEGVSPYWWWWPSNYSREFATEKVADCMFFENGKLVLSQDCGIKVHGGGSRAKSQKSFNLYSRKKYNGYTSFQKNLFGGTFYPKKITLFQGGDDDESKMQDYVVNELTTGLNFCTMNFEPYVVFLDGEYWGVYWLNEKYDENYIRNKYRVLPDNVVIIKNDTLEQGIESDIDLYNDMRNFCINSDMSDPDNYSKACEMIDMDSFVDYYAALLYVGRCGDWPKGNFSVWRSRKIGEGKYNDGKWRYMLFDVNSGGVSNEYSLFDSYEAALEDPFFANMMSNDELRNRLLDRIEQMNTTTFAKDRVDKCIGEFRERMDRQLINSNIRYYGEPGEQMYLNKAKSIEEFFVRRRDYIYQMTAAHR